MTDSGAHILHHHIKLIGAGKRNKDTVGRSDGM